MPCDPVFEPVQLGLAHPGCLGNSRVVDVSRVVVRSRGPTCLSWPVRDHWEENSVNFPLLVPKVLKATELIIDDFFGPISSAIWVLPPSSPPNTPQKCSPPAGACGSFFSRTSVTRKFRRLTAANLARWSLTNALFHVFFTFWRLRRKFWNL